MIEIKDATFYYDNKLILDKLSASFESSHIYGVVGANGAGKSTLLKCLGNIFYCNSGEIFYNNQNIIDNIEYLETLMLLDENTSSNQNTMLSLTKQLAKLKNLEIDYTYLGFLIDMFSIDKSKKIGAMSKGNKRIAFIVAALAIGIQTLILDEFLEGIDMVNRTKMKKELLDYCQKNEAIIIIASHTVSDIGDICDSVVLLKDKKVQDAYEIDDLRAKYSTYQVVMNNKVEKTYFEKLGLSLIKYKSFENISWISIANDNDQLSILDKIECIDIKEVDISLEEVIYNEFKVHKR
ncbi:ABC-2 type transport system ATP-binding protein [Bacilli bacterium PM5-3]|nr:ABC-2 type transport system ATP-binding protein [Bacilli bacterium PM5-3]MDH6603614.1 ABC-2 type transport system ATP-binding protein [Bacilli bacterium PM5-9]